MIGVISLIGIVVNNAIVLIDFIELNRKRKILNGSNSSEMEIIIDSITLAGRTRLRPVILTALTTILGLTKKTRGEQFIFVNNRFIKSTYLGHAIFKSYEGLIEEKQYPFYVLFITLDTEKVDINIHPTKTEIKFDDEKLIYSLVNSTIKKTLDKYNISPSINFDADVNFLKEVVTNYDNKENTLTKKNDIKSLRGNDWDEIFENVRSENKTAKLFQDDDEQIINNKPVQFLDKFIFKQLGEKLLVFNHKNCQQRIIYEKYEKGINKYTNTQQAFSIIYVFREDIFKLIGGLIRLESRCSL